MRVIDVSTPITEKTIMWEDEFKPEFGLFGSIENGDIANSSYIKMSHHTATHIDFPKHFFNEGKTLEDFPIEKFYGEAFVLSIKDDPIDKDR